MTVAAQATLADGRRAEWHDDLGTVGRYRIIAADGATVVSERDYDAFEQGQKADRASRTAMVNNDAVNRAALRDGLAAVTSAIATVNALAGSTTGNTKTLAQNLEIALRGVRRLARIVGGDLSAAD